MDINKKIDEKFKSFEQIDSKVRENNSKIDINSSKIIKNIQPNRSRNMSKLEQNKHTVYESLYNFKTYFSQEKCCHPLRDVLNRLPARKCTIYDFKSLSNNKASFATKDTEAFTTQSKTRIDNSPLINLKRTFPFSTHFKQGKIDYFNPKNKGESLYFKGIEMKLKLEGKIENNINNLNKEKVPVINTNSKKMIERDSSACFERLYPRHMVENVSREGSISMNKGRYPNNIHDIDRRIYRNNINRSGESFSFQPNISERSKSLALKKGNVLDRILAEKKRKRNVDPNIGDMNYFLCNNNCSVIYNRETVSDKKISNFSVNHLYEEAEILKKKKEEKINQVKHLEEISLKESHTFKPDINKSNQKNVKKEKKVNNKESFYQRQERWKKNISTRNEKIKEYFVNLEMEDCTFKPKIKPNILPDDEDFIQKNLSQIMVYVNQRQNVLDNYAKRKNYENKKFFNKPTNFTMKQTICKEFNLKTNKLNRSFNLNTSKYKLNNKEIRLRLNKENFFSEKRLKESTSTKAESPFKRNERNKKTNLNELSCHLKSNIL